MKRNLGFILALGDMKIVAVNDKNGREVFINLADRKRKESMERISQALVS